MIHKHYGGKVNYNGTRGNDSILVRIIICLHSFVYIDVELCSEYFSPEQATSKHTKQDLDRPALAHPLRWQRSVRRWHCGTSSFLSFIGYPIALTLSMQPLEICIRQLNEIEYFLCFCNFRQSLQG